MQLRWSIAAVVAASALTLTGCSGGGDPSAAPTSAPPATTAAPTPAASRTPPTGNARAKHGIAVPGATFSLHKAIGIRFHSGQRSGVLALKITRITRGRATQLKPLGLGSRVRGMVPYYIHFIAKNATRTDLSRAWIKDLVGIDAHGREVRHVLVMGRFPQCPASRAPRRFTKGKATMVCSLAVAPSGARVAGARWRGAPYGPATDRAITWK
ncbi:MAG TPA: hypothetical protein VGL93_07090 [Streptosporangiaceae bacterium]|jgi:hypothetical protein